MKKRNTILALGLVALAGCAAKAPEGGLEDGAPIPLEDVDISDEQDFQAVAARETIESDAARIEANRARYEIVAPEDLPVRPGDSMSLVVEFALATTNPKGQPLYRRPKISREAKFNRNCAKYTSSDLAQEAFLRRGGPKRDPMGMDPDGDGFACYWDPEPFRQARLAAEAEAAGAAGDAAPSR